MTTQFAPQQWTASTAQEGLDLVHAATQLAHGRLLTLSPGDHLARMKLRATTPLTLHITFDDTALTGQAPERPAAQSQAWTARTVQEALDLLDGTRRLIEARMLVLSPGDALTRHRQARTASLALRITVDDSELVRQATEQHALLGEIGEL
ncbi:hypothetical protein [Streptomyces hydrogenans]|uniref:hypothetical protein n=1 Tax=Streptomyces hydrogenans TaxID=1873719 RepID=UPI0034398437